MDSQAQTSIHTIEAMVEIIVDQVVPKNAQNATISRILILILLLLGISVPGHQQSPDDNRFVTYIVDPQKQVVNFYWKDDKGEKFRSISSLKTWLDSRHQKLLFAMNGGMYTPQNSPLGLFIENNVVITKLDTRNASGNFYLKPNGVFYITKENLPVVCSTNEFVNTGKIKFATQSGPMLLHKGQIHPLFKKGSANVNVRNGIGILPGNKIIFAMSKNEINFYDFATYFKNMGCINALYLDGVVSRTYLPEKNWIQTDGDFGVIIGVTTPAKR